MPCMSDYDHWSTEDLVEKLTLVCGAANTCDWQ